MISLFACITVISFHTIIHLCTPQKIPLYYDASHFSSVLFLSYLVSACSSDHQCREARLSVLTFSNFASMIEVDLHKCLGLFPSLHRYFSRLLVLFVRSKGLLLTSFIINFISLLGSVFLYEFVQFILYF